MPKRPGLEERFYAGFETGPRGRRWRRTHSTRWGLARLQRLVQRRGQRRDVFNDDDDNIYDDISLLTIQAGRLRTGRAQPR